MPIDSHDHPCLNTGTVPERIDQLNDQAEYLERTTPAETLKLSQAAHEMAVAVQYPKGIARSLYLIGRGHLRLGNLIDSEILLKRAYDQSLLIPALDLQANILNTQGIVNLYLRIYDQSFKYFQRALAISRKIDDRSIEARVLNNLGEIYRELKDYNAALNYYQQSRDIHHNVESPINKSVAISNIAALYLEMDDLEHAEVYVQQATALANEEQNLMIMSACRQYAGVIARKRGQYNKSLAYLNESLKINHETMELIHEAEVLVEIHKTLIEKGDRDLSFEVLKGAVNIGRKLNSHPLLLKIYNELVPACEALSRTDDALHYSKLRYEAIEAIERVELEQRLRGLEIQMEADTSSQEKESYRVLSQQLEQKAKELEDRSNELQDAYHTLKAISEIGKKITAVHSLESIYELVYQQISDLMAADLFGIGLYDPLMDSIRYAYLIEDGIRLNNIQIPLSRNNSFAVWCYRHRKELLVNSDKEDVSHFVGHFTSSFGDMMPAIMFHPLIVEDQIIGVMTVQSRRRNVYTPQTLETLGTLSAYLSVAILNAQKSEALHKEIQHREAAQNKLHQLNQELAALSEQDSLTGIANRRRFEEFYLQEWSRALRAHEPLSLMMIDVDHFKQYNDTYGHVAGDEIIVKIAGLICHNVKRTSDLVARYGGDEFIILLSNTDEGGALKVAADIQKIVAEAGLAHESSPISRVITLSIGLSSVTPRLDLVRHEIVQNVDQALYEAKEHGRNQIIIYKIESNQFTPFAS
jgi:diguanylate cyclase (GGDEF)-like protein